MGSGFGSALGYGPSLGSSLGPGPGLGPSLGPSLGSAQGPNLCLGSTLGPGLGLGSSLGPGLGSSLGPGLGCGRGLQPTCPGWSWPRPHRCRTAGPPCCRGAPPAPPSEAKNSNRFSSRWGRGGAEGLLGPGPSVKH